MAIKFDFYRTPSLTGTTDEEHERYHARVIVKQTVSTEDLIHQIHERSTLSKGDIMAVLSELREALKLNLLNGNNVSLDGIGLYSLTLEAPQDTNPEKTRAQNLRVKRIEFRADRQLRKEIIASAHLERCCDKLHSAPIEASEIEALLTNYFAQNAYITRKRFEELCHLTKNTANRQLKRLVEEGKLFNSNTPRNPNYEPVKGHYGTHPKDKSSTDTIK